MENVGVTWRCRLRKLIDCVGISHSFQCFLQCLSKPLKPSVSKHLLPPDRASDCNSEIRILTSPTGLSHRHQKQHCLRRPQISPESFYLWANPPKTNPRALTIFNFFSSWMTYSRDRIANTNYPLCSLPVPGWKTELSYNPVKLSGFFFF